MELKSNREIKSRLHAGDVVYKILVTAGILLFSLSFAFVLVWMLCNSVRPQKSYFNDVLAFWNLKGATFDNYVRIFTTKYGSAKITMFGMLKNSFILIIVCTALQAIVPVITGYAVARYKTKLGAVAVQLVIISMVVPAIGSTASTYSFMSAIKLKDKWLGIFLMNAGGLGFGMLLYKNYFSSISWEYAESAFLDGAGNLRVFFSIMYPQALPLIVSMAILNVIGLWNDYMTPYLFLNSKPTVALGVYSIQTRAERNGAMPQAFAAMTFMTIFVLIIYAAFSKTIMSSMSVGGLKG
ncbi:MAG: carbohydrate ABC transporter permease [Clostridia bacterium]|nr:carbohydrate ABC transporter permease [Clostridiales bacterium]MDD7165300.1 carbohydrate ABC transporter permease [Clostridia bacterium]MDY2901712.1 carbohydrate ABC transporter permease [Christensenellaceae bacterium]